MSSTATPSPEPRLLDRLLPYLQIMRIDYWFKNAFMLLGVLLAFSYDTSLIAWNSLDTLFLAVISTCLIASSNYTLNELLDSRTDKLHPQKKNRPVPSGKVRPAIAYGQWILLAVVGIWLAFLINPNFAYAAIWLWVMGIAYNVPPVRTKDWPYVDVLSESVNNAIRLLLGWFALISHLFPPVSLILAYWMAGAFFMATKRFAELRRIGDPAVAAGYRKSFGFYNEDRLLVSMLFYVTACGLFSGMFIVRYHLELILYVPIAAGFFAYYLNLGLKPNSPVQNPEKLHRERGFLIYSIVSVIFFVLLMFTNIPVFYDWFHVDRSRAAPLWTLGSPPH